MTTNYTTFQSQFFNYVAAYTSDTNWTTEFPLVIDRAEQRIYRDLDLLATRITDTSATTSSGVRSLPLPTSIGTFLVIEDVSIFTPSSLGTTGARNQVVPISRQFIDVVYPSSETGVPEWFCRTDATNIIFGPAPDQAYSVEIVGTQRPSVLSSGNSSTVLTQLVPDLFFAAAMCEASGFMRNYGEQSDNPQMAQSWENTYKMLLTNAMAEEMRKKFMSQGWTMQLPNPIATPPRA